MVTSTKPPRLLYLDNIRVFCIALVVMQHAAVTYSGLGSWYYKESSALGPGSFLCFGLLQSHAQAFFMSMFFLIAGYFVPGSLERKGPRKFVIDRLVRLGVPLLVYVLLLHPLLVKVLHPSLNVSGYYLKGVRDLDMLSWTGPLWFVEVLLIFTLLCVPLASRLKPSEHAMPPRLPARWLWLTISLVTAGAFALRLVYPMGTSAVNLQLGYFSAYTAAFAVGVWAGTCNGLESISYRSARRWLIAAFGIGLPLWFSAFVAGGVSEGRMEIGGGMNLGSALFALWESFFCVAIIVALLGLAREKLNFQKPSMRFLADNTFGVYVFHAVILVLVSLALRPLVLPALSKFVVVTIAALACSFAFSWLVRLAPPVRRVFS